MHEGQSFSEAVLARVNAGAAQFKRRWLGTQFCATWLVSQEERAVKLGSLNVIADIATGGKAAAKKQTLASIVIG